MAIQGLTEEEFARLDMVKGRLRAVLPRIDEPAVREAVEYAIEEVEDLMGPGAM